MHESSDAGLGTVPFGFSIVGVQKAATSTVSELLANHPMIARPERKEQHYFDNDARPWQRSDHPTYNVARTDPVEVVAGDNSPSYIFHPSALSRMRRYNPEMRLIACFRDPLERLFSHWAMARTLWAWTPDWPQFITEYRPASLPAVLPPEAPPRRFVERMGPARGLYGQQLARGYQLFPLSQWLLLEFHELLADHHAALDRATEHLRLDPFEGYPRLVHEMAGAGQVTGTRPCGPDIRALAEYYGKDLRMFADLSGLDISHWPTCRILCGALDPGELAARFACKVVSAENPSSSPVESRRAWNPRTLHRMLGRQSQRTPPAKTSPTAPPSPVQRLLDSGIFDAEFYATSVGRRFPDASPAARDCIEVGMRRGISPNPFLLLSSLPKPVHDRVRAGEVGRLLAYLRSDRGRSKPSGPLFLGEAAPATREELAHQPGGALGWLMRTASDETEMPAPAGYPGRVPTFAEARQAAVDFAATLAEHRSTGGGDPADTAPEPAELASWRSQLVDWAVVDPALPARVAGRVSVVIPTHGDSAMTTRAVLSVLKTVGDVDVEVVVVDDGSEPDVGRRLHDRFLTAPRVRYHRLPRNFGFAAASDVGFAMSTGTRVVFLNNDTVARAGWLAPLMDHLGNDQVAGVQPLLLHDNDTIQTAGTVFPTENGLPCHFLRGHPREDADAVAGLTFSAVTAAALMMRAEDVAALRGFDTAYVNGMEDVDLCLRALELRPGGFRVEPRAVVNHLEGKTPGRNSHIPANRRQFMAHWHGRLPGPETEHFRACGFTVEHVGGDAQPIPAPRPVLTRIREAGAEPAPAALRWGIRLSSTPGPWGDRWGDTHFADSLAAALRRQGQQVVTYRRGAHHTQAAYLDDVVLGIRGLHPVRPHPGKLNVLWVISHPDDVTVEELAGFDLVFAASEPWSAQMSARAGRPVQPLLQATDARWVPDRATPVGDGARPVFVGTAETGRSRRVVDDAIEAGIVVAVHGPGWDDLAPPARWESDYVAPASLPSLYREHGLVLADHWPDMAAHGFLANRLFDAVAAGARVISDEVAGVEEVFHDAVQVYRSIEELAFLCGPEGGRRFADEHAMTRISEHITYEHSLDRRADELLQAVATSKGHAQ